MSHTFYGNATARLDRLLRRSQNGLLPPRSQIRHKTRQINQPLGTEQAKEIAFELSITKDMQLTKKEYKEFIGTRGTRRNNPNQAIIYNWVQNLSNSTSNPIKVDTNGDGKKDTEVVLGG